MAKWRDVKQHRIDKSLKPVNNLSPANEFVSIAARLKAFLIDTFIVTTPLFYIVIYFFIGSLPEFSENRAFGWSIILISNYLIIASLWLSKSQTPGLKAYNLKIVNQDKQKISFFQSIIRYVATVVAVVSIVLLFLPFFNKQKKSFQDLVSNTMIINEN